MKFTKIIVFAVIAVMMVTLLSCSMMSSPVGKWYNPDGMCLDIRSDGTWKIDGAYSAGTWIFFNDDNAIELTDFYGGTKRVKIGIDDNGEYIIYGDLGSFYRDGYSTDNMSADTADTIDTSDTIEKSPTFDKHDTFESTPLTFDSQFETDVQTEPETIPEPTIIKVDPFTGLKVKVTGISPYCEINLNNQECDVNAQKYVTYMQDKKSYANGESVVIYASLSTWANNEAKLQKRVDRPRIRQDAQKRA